MFFAPARRENVHMLNSSFKSAESICGRTELKGALNARFELLHTYCFEWLPYKGEAAAEKAHYGVKIDFQLCLQHFIRTWRNEKRRGTLAD